MSLCMLAQISALPQLDQIDPGTVALIVIGGIILLALIAGSSGSSSSPQQAATPPEPSPSPSDRKTVEDVIGSLQGTTGQNRLGFLTSLAVQLPARLPEDRIPALLEGTRGDVRVDAVALLKPKFPANLSAAVIGQIVDQNLMGLEQRERALRIILGP